MTTIQPMTINISQTVLDDLQVRLAATRWTDEVQETEWDYGTNLGYVNIPHTRSEGLLRTFTDARESSCKSGVLS